VKSGTVMEFGWEGWKESGTIISIYSHESRITYIRSESVEIEQIVKVGNGMVILVIVMVVVISNEVGEG
jgi:hypothetical protein